MPLITPVLDDRDFEALFAELRDRIATYNPAWTDHHDSDPGITLLQLFAYLGEGLLFRLNQVPEATQLAFLKLLDLPLRPAQAARAMLRFDSAVAQGVVLYQGDRVQAGKTVFTVDDDLTVWPLDSVAVSRRALLTEAETADPARITRFVADALARNAEIGRALQGSIDAVRDEQGDDVPVAPYETLTLDSSGQQPALDPGASVDRHLWIAVLKARDCKIAVADLADPAKGLQNADGRPLTLAIGLRPETQYPGLADIGACGAANGPALQWQASVRRADGTLGYTALRSAGDRTAGFTQEGVVRLELPADLGTLGAPPPPAGLAGIGDLPPELDDDRAERLWFWLRVWRGDGSRLVPVKWLALNAVTCEQTQAASPELLGTGTGQPGQVWQLSQRPVAPGHAVQLQVEESEGWKDWSGVENLDASGADDRHFSVDAEAGTVRFGARYPQLSQRIRVLGYRSGGGAAGNVPAGAIAKLGVPGSSASPPPPLLRAVAASGLKLANPFTAAGGADAESIADALQRVPTELRRNHRAVTQDDFSSLALQTPACEIGRAECLPRFHAPSRSRKPGCVSVIVWPARDTRHPAAPVPDAWQLTQVCRWLDRWRLVTTELYVAPPTYRRIAVGVQVKVRAGFGLDGVRDWVNVALRQYLAPLPPHGPAGAGWPLGRRVMARELEGVVMQVEGVDYVESLRLDLASTPAAGLETWAAAATVPLADWEVPELAAVTVLDDRTALPAPGAGLVPPPSRPAVPVPVIRDEC